ncbi:hypothetical protein [Piscinibacter terrae]|uniref:Uncharacterized protein n=1 Tax=Piscinibacter terrae TaxID=2496871 RepID=A0A3N7HLJ5_9BURK|nr:hypothetical protein [Albitalea terrae]RQP21906.1 hypothetical protein DZC73_26060 [Albitalea terrae]
MTTSDQDPALQAAATPEDEQAASTLRRHVMAEIMVMLRFAWSRGVDLPVELPGLLSCIDPAACRAREACDAQAPLAALAELHALLARAVAPAMPVTLALMECELHGTGWRGVLGPIGNVRRLVVAAFAFLLLFVAISMAPALNAESMDGDIYTLDGLSQIVVMVFLLSAAGIGGTFQALFTAQRYVADATYDPRYDGSYWSRIALGLVAGLLLSVLVPVSLEGAESPTLAKPVLALLGGFSSGLVYRIMQRLVETIESLFQSRAPTARGP